MRTILFLFILFCAFGCGKNTAEKTDEAIDIALTHLSKDECDEALDILRDAGMQGSNGVYLQVLASAYACKAGFDEIKFVADDLGALVTTSGQAIFKSLAKMSLSNETEADSVAFTSIRTGINTILGSTSGDPSQVSRTEKFGPRRAGDLGVQALILSLVNFGKFLQYYGSTDVNGVKGGCFIDYNDPRAQLIVTTGPTGACSSTNNGHADLDQTTAAGKRRMCEGLMLLTNSLDILNNIDFSGSSTLSKLEDVATQVNNFRTAAVAVGLGAVIDMTSQSECEAFANVPAQLLDLEYFYALTFEQGLL